MTKIGVFDSGIGGKSIALKLEQLFPEAEIISVDDSKNVPYGTKSEDDIKSLTLQAIKPLLDTGCDAIVIACNTATAVAIETLRITYPDVHFVGIEPMVKPASKITKTKTIAVLATPRTLSSERYHNLKNEWAAGINVIEPDCATWAGLIESHQLDTIPVEKTITDAINHNADVIVLGCTHYHWLKERVQAVAGYGVAVLEPSDAIGARLDSLLATATELRG